MIRLYSFLNHLVNLSLRCVGLFCLFHALFLRRFIEKAKAWAHFDIYGWNPSTKPARPEGGDAQTARLLYGLLEARYGKM